MKKQIYWIVVILAVFLLTSCGANVDQAVTFYRDETWKAKTTFHVSAEMLSSIGSVPQIEAELDKAIAELEAIGIAASWKSRPKEDVLIYDILMEGSSLALLNQAVFDGQATLDVEEVGGERQVHFSHFVMGTFAQSNSYTLTLTGKEVVSSNGRSLDDSSVQWINPNGQMEAVLTEKNHFNWVWLLIIAVTIAIIGGGSWYWRQQQPQQYFCKQCNTAMAAQAQFCPRCGQKR